MRGQSEIVPREGAKTPRARDGRGGDARDDARAMGEGNREGGCGKNEPTARSCEYYRRWRARTHRSSLTRGARSARARRDPASPRRRPDSHFLANFIQRERGPGVVHGGVLAALNVQS